MALRPVEWSTDGTCWISGQSMHLEPECIQVWLTISRIRDNKMGFFMA